MRVLSAFLLLSVVLLSACNNNSDQTPTSLALHLIPGGDYRYVSSVDIDQVVDEQNVQIKLSATYHLVPAAEKAGEIAITATHERYFMDVSAGGQTMQIDTDKKDTDTESGPADRYELMMRQLFSGVVGQPFQLSVNTEGEITGMSGLDNMINRIVDSMGVSGETAAQMRISLKDAFSEEKMKYQLASLFDGFRNQPVAVGDTWKKQRKIDFGGNAGMDQQFTVRAIDGNQVTLDVTGTLEVPASANAGALSGTTKGVVVLQLDKGLVSSMELNLNLQGDSGGIPMKITGKLKVTGEVK